MNPEMIIVTLVRGERWVGQPCPNCRKAFKIGDEVFESANQQTALHVTCVVALALVATLRPPSEITVTAQYEQLREELIDAVLDRTPDA